MHSTCRFPSVVQRPLKHNLQSPFNDPLAMDLPNQPLNLLPVLRIPFSSAVRRRQLSLPPKKQQRRRLKPRKKPLMEISRLKGCL